MQSRITTEHEGRAIQRFRRLVAPLFALFFVLMNLAPAVVSAATLISQGYVTSTAIPIGSIVSLKKDSTDTVEPTTPSTTSNILGVVINGGNSQVSISSDKTQVQVATNNLEPVLVSDINGAVSIGDPITGSPISGVGMKATNNAKVVGIAQENLPNGMSSKQQYTDKSGAKHDVNIGTITVLVNVAYFYKTPDKTLVPSTIQNIANALAGKQVETLPILVSAAIFIITLIIVVSIIYSMIHSSIISVGRNPMAQSAVYRNVIQLSVLVILILGVSLAAIFLVLRKF